MQEFINYGFLTALKNFNAKEFELLNKNEIESFNNQVRIVTIAFGVSSEKIAIPTYQIKIDRFIADLNKEAVVYSFIGNLLKIYLGNYIYKEIIEDEKKRKFLSEVKDYSLSKFILKFNGII